MGAEQVRTSKAGSSRLRDRCSCLRDTQLVVQRGRVGSVLHRPSGGLQIYRHAGTTTGRFQALLSPPTAPETLTKVIGDGRTFRSPSGRQTTSRPWRSPTGPLASW